MPDQENENAIRRPHTTGEFGKRVFHVFLRGPAANPFGIPFRPFGKVDNVIGGKTEAFRRGIDHRHAPAMKRVAVLRLPTETAHDDDVTVTDGRLSGKDTGNKQDERAHLGEPPQPAVAPLRRDQHHQHHEDHRHVP